MNQTTPGKIEHGTRLSAIATSDVVALAPDERVGEAARVMASRRISSVVVSDDGIPVGIVTERNLLQAMSSGCPAQTELRSIMSHPVTTVPGSMTCLDAYQLCLRHGIRHLVIVDSSGRLLGVISETDFRLHLDLTTPAGRRQVASLVTRSLSCLPPSASLIDAVSLMQSHRDSCVVVIEDERPVGIVTERDIVRLYSENPQPSDWSLAEVMSAPVHAISLDETIERAAQRMQEFEIRHLVAVDGAGRMAGLVNERDLSQRLIQGVNDEKAATEGALLQTLMNAIPDLVWLKDQGGCYLSCNQRFGRLMGAPESEIIGKRDHDFIERQLAESWRELDRQAIENDGPVVNEQWVNFADDGHRELLETIRLPMRDAAGKLIGVLGIARDITARKQVERQLAERESLFRAIFDQVPAGIELIDPESLRFVEANPAACNMLGYTHSEFLQLRLTDTQADQDEEKLARNVQQTGIDQSAIFENRHRSKSGQILDVEIRSRMLELSGRRLLVGVWRDITEHKRAEENLRITASVFDNCQEAIVITDSGNAIIDVNPAFTHITGYSREEALGRNPSLLSSGRQDQAFYSALWQSLQQKKAWRGEIWNRRKSGEVYAGLLSIAAICDESGQALRYVGVFSDISPIKAHEAELSRIAHYDMLTGIPNRVLLADRLGQAVIRQQRSGGTLAVCYMDLDGFKQVNDQYGHEVGDRLLVEVTRRLQQALRAGDTIARLGGDEFVILFNDLASEQECFLVLDRILENVSAPVVIDGRRITVSASIGVTFYPGDHDDCDTLLRHADQAMYLAKQSGRNRHQRYDSQQDQRARNLHESRRRFLAGLEQGEFELYYQPRVELASGRLAGAEALIRWHHPESGLLLPARFLPLIEGSDLEIQLGEWVMDSALSQLERWNQEGLPIEVSINISARHLASPDFVCGLERKLLQHPQLPTGWLQIEVLETAALQDIAQTSETIDACRRLGVGFALDDFGTGYSSLTYLRQLEVNTLKIDQSFIRGMLDDEGDFAIVQGIVALAKTFGRKTVAEGVEQSGYIPELVSLGCGYGQGYAIAHPMPKDEFMNWCRGRASATQAEN